MSLVVCKIIDQDIFIETDSRISNAHETKRESNYGIVKSVIIAPQVCISFAGSINLAEDAIREIYNQTTLTIQSAVEILHKFNSDGNKIEFILSSIQRNQPRIYRIWNNKVESNLPSAWIGDDEAFTEFQKQFHQIKASGRTETDSFFKAFTNVIDNPELKTVGDFQISLRSIKSASTDDRFFLYTEKMYIQLGRDKTYTVENGKSEFTFQWGTAQEGSYGFAFFSSVDAFKPSIGLYFYFGNFGVLFYPRQSFKGIEIKGNIFEFLDKVKKEYGIPLKGMVLRHNNTALQLVDMREPIEKYKKVDEEI